jgi:hypothetical protein
VETNSRAAGRGKESVATANDAAMFEMKASSPMETVVFLQQECSAFFIAPQSPAIFLQQAISALVICETVATQARLGVAMKAASKSPAKMERENLT